MYQLPNFRPTKAVIDLAAIKYNIEQLRKHLHSNIDIIAVVKANAYGHGDIQVANAALQAGASMLAVATPEEALHLREFIKNTPILILGASPVSFAPYAAQYNITLTVFSVDWLSEVAKQAKNFEKPLKLHIKIDSGMGRIGVRKQTELIALYNAIVANKRLIIDGIFTHFASADEENPKQFKEQLATFKALVASLPEKPRFVHAANTAASLIKDDVQFDAVRFGIAMYGLVPSPYVEKHLPFILKPALSLESELVHVKKIERGDTVSYGGNYVAVEEEWIGTMPIGYADGLVRGLAGQEVLIQGNRVPIVGRICMDQCMVKLPYNMVVGEKVILIGQQHQEMIKIEEWSERLHTIVYEIPCMLTSRITRIYK
ncbi:alanine racemase [Viridibacillus sp. YIM B01967]|uniref:Alanine racemase n=1 Tax=Viridibacillus soli TaxID=2798301 RepID=A0ABS1H526_9BACL|nr:alanine racemase [Viridibacillus soli]MBK3494509.1 alanine racemase [Viridibacillus soli]